MCTTFNTITGPLADRPSSDNHIDSSSPSRLPRPFDTLPAEIINRIFTETRPHVSIPGDPHVMGPRHRLRFQDVDPLILSMVCKRWQALTVAYPSLWATMTIRCSRLDQKAWDQWGFSKLGNYLRRSGAHPLKIRIKAGETTEAVIGGILDLVALHSKQWREMVFEFPLGQKFLQKLDSLVGQLPLLENVYFHISDFQNPTPATSTAIKGGDFLGSPSLKRIGFGTNTVLKSLLPHITWQHVREVTFNFSTFEHERDLREILECLSGSTAVLIFSSVSVGFPRTEVSNSHGPVRLEMVHELHMEGLRGLLDVFVCPSLEHLEIQNAYASEHGEDEIACFLKNSSCYLTHIHVCDILVRHDGHGPRRRYNTVFQSPSLSTLKSISLERLADSALDLLDLDSHKLFPLLKTIYLDILLRMETDGIQYITSRIEGLQKVVESRTVTQAASPNPNPNHDRSESLQSVDTTNTRTRQVSLKYCYFTFGLDTDRAREDADVQLVETMLETLRLFCVSRGVKIQQEFRLPIHLRVRNKR